MNVTVRPVIARSPWPTMRAHDLHAVAASQAQGSRRQLDSRYDEPADHEIVGAAAARCGRDARGARGAAAQSCPRPRSLASVVSLTVHVTGAAGTSAPASSRTLRGQVNDVALEDAVRDGTIVTDGTSGNAARRVAARHDHRRAWVPEQQTAARCRACTGSGK